ncbi:MAG: hypothetical protein IT559_03660 [Alphaproteobacteria bacterium]|nr:hypothetical protein [Alphaproteobacteria bacterium]
MNQHAAYLIQILEKIGAPLMSAIIQAAPNEETATPQEAQTIAALLAKTVQASIDLGNVMEINPADSMDDSLRVALAALAGPIVAGQYRRRGQIPEDAALKRITGALQAVLSFSENFAPSAESAERLSELKARGQYASPTQTQVQYVQAFIPVVEAIAEFPFGQAEQKLLMEVSDRLVKKSVELRETLLPTLNEEGEQKRAELGLLQALADTYSAAHRAETAKVMAAGEAGRAHDISMSAVWKNFDTRAAMLEALTGALGLSGKKTVTGGGGGQAPAQTTTRAQAPPATPLAAAPAQTPPPVSPQPAAPPQAAAPATAQNPMSMFSKPKEGSATDAPPAAPSPTTPPPSESPPQNSAEEETPAKPAPMSFFKKSE